MDTNIFLVVFLFVPQDIPNLAVYQLHSMDEIRRNALKSEIIFANDIREHRCHKAPAEVYYASSN